VEVESKNKTMAYMLGRNLEKDFREYDK